MISPALEPVGDLKFDPPAGGPIVPESNWEDWLDWAMVEYELSRRAAQVLNLADQELEALVRDGDDIDSWVDLIETAVQSKKRHEAGREVMGAVVCRLLIVMERILGKEIWDAGEVPS